MGFTTAADTIILAWGIISEGEQIISLSSSFPVGKTIFPSAELRISGQEPITQGPVGVEQSAQIFLQITWPSNSSTSCPGIETQLCVERAEKC